MSLSFLVYKTGLHDRPKLVIPLINEIFQEHYKGQEQIEFLECTHYLKDPDGKLVERTNDSLFQVLGERKEWFHVETQDGVSVHEVAVFKLGNYSLDDIFAKKYENVVKGVKKVMMGSGIDYPGRDIYYEGRALGHEEGRGIGLKEGRGIGLEEGLAAGERKAYLALFKDGVITLQEVAKRLNVSEEVVKCYL